MLHAHNTIEDRNDLTNKTIIQLEKFFGKVRFLSYKNFLIKICSLKSTKTSISKVLIYHTNSPNDSTLPSQQMITSQIQKSKENSPMILNYSLSTQDGCQVAILECSNVTFNIIF